MHLVPLFYGRIYNKRVILQTRYVFGEEMEMKDLLPVIGVALGWGLSELGGFLKARSSRARSIKQAITTLYKLNFEMLQVRMSQENYKNLNPTSLEEWERGRQRAFENYIDLSPNTLDKIKESILLISQEYPLIAFRLDRAISTYCLIKGKKLDSFVTNKEVYLKMLGGFETTQLGSQYIVEETIFKLAFKVDFLLWVQFKLDTKKYKKNIQKGDLVHSSQAFGGKKT